MPAERDDVIKSLARELRLGGNIRFESDCTGEGVPKSLCTEPRLCGIFKGELTGYFSVSNAE